MPINHLNYQVVAKAVSAYADERYTHARLLNSTGIVDANSGLVPNAEGFTGQLRWYKPITADVNTASLTDPTAGTYTTLSTQVATYIKNVKAIGINQVNVQTIISHENALAKFSADLARQRAINESEAVRHVLQGVAAHEIARGGGIVDFDSIPAANLGAFVDLNAEGAFGAAATGAVDARRLMDPSQAGAAQGSSLYRAMGMAWKDYEPDYAYMITSPETYADLRGANLIDDTTITDGNIEFQTIFNGKFRLILSRANQGNFATSANVNDQSTKTTFLVKPGALAWATVDVPEATEIKRDAAAYHGGGTTALWYRYGFVVHPMGYDWVGATTAFPALTDYAVGASWERRVDPLNLGVIPILHA